MLSLARAQGKSHPPPIPSLTVAGVAPVHQDPQSVPLYVSVATVSGVVHMCVVFVCLSPGVLCVFLGGIYVSLCVPVSPYVYIFQQPPPLLNPLPDLASQAPSASCSC